MWRLYHLIRFCKYVAGAGFGQLALCHVFECLQVLLMPSIWGLFLDQRLSEPPLCPQQVSPEINIEECAAVGVLLCWLIWETSWPMSNLYDFFGWPFIRILTFSVPFHQWISIYPWSAGLPFSCKLGFDHGRESLELYFLIFLLIALPVSFASCAVAICRLYIICAALGVCSVLFSFWEFLLFFWAESYENVFPFCSVFDCLTNYLINLECCSVSNLSLSLHWMILFTLSFNCALLTYCELINIALNGLCSGIHVYPAVLKAWQYSQWREHTLFSASKICTHISTLFTAWLTRYNCSPFSSQLLCWLP